MDSSAESTTVAIQVRPYLLQNEFSLRFSYFPLDQFNHFQAVGATYTRYFNDYFGWEIPNASLMKKKSTGLEEFINGKGAVTENFDVMNWSIMTNVIFTPIYMKSLSFEKNVIWGDLSFVGGYGITSFEKAKSVNTLDFGVLIRYFIYEKWAVKADLRQYAYLGSGLKPNLEISLGLSFNFSEFDSKAVVEDND